MKVKALDQLHVSSVKAETIRPDEEFELGDAEAKSLAERGLVKIIGAGAKAAAAPENKMEKAPENKAAPSTATKVAAAPKPRAAPKKKA